jgi:hypothetical protein
MEGYGVVWAVEDAIEYGTHKARLFAKCGSRVFKVQTGHTIISILHVSRIVAQPTII